jgi:hypothetical protein
MNRVLVFTEKHRTRYFDASTDELLESACLKILRERNELGYYYEPDAPRQEKVTEEDVEAASNDYLKKVAKAQLGRYQMELRRFQQEIDEYHMIKSTLDNNDGKLAYQILQGREDYEYEGMRLEFLETLS